MLKDIVGIKAAFPSTFVEAKTIVSKIKKKY
jgi:hypothetical protein